MNELTEILTKLYCCAIAEHKAGKDSLLSKSLDNAERDIIALLPKRVEVTPAGVEEVMAKAFDEDVPVNTVLANWFNNLGKENEE